MNGELRHIYYKLWWNQKKEVGYMPMSYIQIKLKGMYVRNSTLCLHWITDRNYDRVRILTDLLSELSRLGFCCSL